MEIPWNSICKFIGILLEIIWNFYCKKTDELRIEEVLAKNTKGGGASRYNPIMLLKVLIYCYMTGTYSSRMIAKQCRENVNVMWLTGFQKPDFRTINKFRSEKLKDSIEEIFVNLQ